MPIVGTVESLWRYPVKSMRGEELNEMFAGYAGVYGDRLFAFNAKCCDTNRGSETPKKQHGLSIKWRLTASRRA